ncbi:MAG: di-trans,poly-cis-decaprenylcistransferase [Pelagibacterales bacterium]|nr:di-trans,poly-cis-decaprenylcistransferase [Pelagibacterales bacterium]
MSNKSINHISIIMDGNGRWANSKNMPRAYGHRAGIKSIRKIVDACTLRQVSTLTLFAFSSENWKRPKYEVNLLINLFSESINKYLDELNSNDIVIKFIGNMEVFDKKLLNNIKIAENTTKDNKGMLLNLAINYGGQWDIINAFKIFVSSNKNDINIDDININNIEKHLSLKTNNPDLLIRTGGEQRLSNFMLWQHAYTELYFTDCLWPDFDENELDAAIKFFQDRTRKFGALENQNNSLKKDA